MTIAASFKESVELHAELSSGAALQLQEKTVTPTDTGQIVLPDKGHALSRVTVGAIPSNYGKITYNGYELSVT